MTKIYIYDGMLHYACGILDDEGIDYDTEGDDTLIVADEDLDEVLECLSYSEADFDIMEEED